MFVNGYDRRLVFGYCIQATAPICAEHQSSTNDMPQEAAYQADHRAQFRPEMLIM